MPKPEQILARQLNAGSVSLDLAQKNLAAAQETIRQHYSASEASEVQQGLELALGQLALCAKTIERVQATASTLRPKR